jgi:hypothetical protein
MLLHNYARIKCFARRAGRDYGAKTRPTRNV